MTGQPRDEALAQAVRLREQGHAEQARTALLALAARYPGDGRIAYQVAWVHDLLGLEAEAVPFYEAALAGADLPAAQRRGAFVGLGSTYRVLGRFDRAVAVLRLGLAEFPDDAAMATFLAMARYNTGATRDAVSGLLKLLAATSADPSIQRYARAIDAYADDLDTTV